MDTQPPNAQLLAEFDRYLIERKSALKSLYQKRLAEDLSRQQWQGCLQRNVLAVLEAFYADALRQLQSMPFDARQSAVNAGMSDLTRQMLPLFHGISDDFLSFVVDQHRTSCALSNFPDEHKPDNGYINDVKRDIAALWKDFALNSNHYFLECR